MAMSTASGSIGITGSGNINTNTDGIIRYRDADCYDKDNGNKVSDSELKI